MKPLVILGSGGLAREIAWLIEDNNKNNPEWEILGFVSDDHFDSEYRYPILGDDEWLLNYPKKIDAVCAIGNPEIKERIWNRYKENENISFPVIISRHAVVSDSAKMEDGVIICAGSIVSVNTNFGRFTICDRKTTIGHESCTGNYVTISPGANVSGNVKIGERAFLGTGSNIIQGISIGDNSIIGAGATVIRDIPENCTAVGVPARIINSKE